MNSKNKTIVITGSEGFTGKVLLSLLKNNGAKVVCTGLSKKADKLYYQCNLANEKSVMNMIRKIKPDEIYHLAGSFSNDFNVDLYPRFCFVMLHPRSCALDATLWLKNHIMTSPTLVR